MASLFATTIVVLWIFLRTCVTAQNSVCPTACDCLFPMVDCSERGLTGIPQDLPDWVEILDLRSNDISEIQEDVFRGFNTIRQLDLSNNKLNSSNTLMFKHLPHLQELKLAFNQFTQIPVLGANSNITKLVLHHNKIPVIDRTRLERLPKLAELDLSHNLITELTNTTFPAGLPLENLFLSNNKIRNVTRESFRNISSLRWLKLNKNLLTSIDHKPFTDLSSLRSLELMRNSIARLIGMNFQGMSNLHTLKLRKNRLVISQDAPFFGLPRLEHLQLDGNKVTKLENKLLYGLDSIKQLLLAHNHISVINQDWIKTKTYNSLEQLDLSKNRLQTIGEDAFVFAPNLRKLSLNNNRLKHIEQTAFKSLLDLQVIELANNHLSATIEDDQSAIFKDLQSLEELGLQNNNIQSISKTAFEGLGSLRRLFLTNNNISTIEETAFDGLSNLDQFHINTTKLVCDCQTRWLPNWLILKNFRSTVRAHCAYPAWMIGKDVMSLSIEDFICKDSPKPVITQHPQKKGAIKGSNVTLQCAAASSSSAPMRYQWKKDNKVIVDDDIHETSIYAASAGDGEITQYTSVLHIRHVEDEAKGRYHCILTNDFGAAYSHKAQIDVYVFPVITKIPGPITVKAGSSARLECAATGHPKPEVAWQKDGGNDFPAAREWRLELKNDDMFVIKDVNIADQGVYSCTATNPAGTVVANATLTVLQPPSFLNEMKRTEYANIGSTAAIKCLSSGSPKPKVVWFKDGQPLNGTKRHFFTTNQEVLIIMEVAEEDQGKYMCEMYNTLGKKRGETTLYIRNADGSIVGKSLPDAMSTTTGIIVISVVCCVVGTSLIWVIIIYQTRKKSEEYSSTPTDETTIPEGPELVIHGDREMSTNSSDPSKSDHFLEYQGSQGSRGSQSSQESPRLFGKNGKLRTAAIFPSDVSDDDHHQLTTDEHRPAQNSESSIDRLCLMPNSDSDSLRSAHSNHSNHSNGSLPFRTFKPHDGSAHSLPRVTENPLTRFVELHEPSCQLAVVHGHAKPSSSHNNNQTKIHRQSPGDAVVAQPCLSCDSKNKTDCVRHASAPCATCSDCQQCHLAGSGQFDNCRPPGSPVHADDTVAPPANHPNHHSLRSPQKCQSNGLATAPSSSASPYTHYHNHISPRNQTELPLARSHLPSIPASIPIPPCRT